MGGKMMPGTIRRSLEVLAVGEDIYFKSYSNNGELKQLIPVESAKFVLVNGELHIFDTEKTSILQFAKEDLSA